MLQRFQEACHRRGSLTSEEPHRHDRWDSGIRFRPLWTWRRAHSAV